MRTLLKWTGRVFLDEPAIGRFVASNLTRGKGGVGASYTDDDWVRAIRHGVGPDGKALLIMPSQEFFNLSDADVRCRRRRPASGDARYAALYRAPAPVPVK